MSLKDTYAHRFTAALEPAARALQVLLSNYCSDLPRVDRITVRPKSITSFLEKAETNAAGQLKYSDPLSQIQDQIGARIVTFYLGDVDATVARIRKYINPIEITTIVPDSESEFGYFGRHLILLMPTDIAATIERAAELLPPFFELQVKTLYQHAWAEANHDLSPDGSHRDIAAKLARRPARLKLKGGKG